MTLRLFWFIVGAGTASWWIKSHDKHGPHHDYSCPRLEDKKRATPGNSPQQTYHEQKSDDGSVVMRTWRWGHNSEGSFPSWEEAHRRFWGWGWGSRENLPSWDEMEKRMGGFPPELQFDRERVQAIGKQAGETVRLA